MDDLIKDLEKGKVSAAAKLISLLENGTDYQLDQIMEKVYPKTGHSWVIGITGPPGAGKSSLLTNLISKARNENMTVGAILVDPTSPVSGGAVLGDRIRMSSLSADKDVFIRSMGSRGIAGGLSTATLAAVRILDCLKKDIIFVETVGTGQIDVDICDIADTVCLVIMPGGGDVIQSLKAGIMEVNDIFIVNKCDRPGAQETAANIEVILGITQKNVERDYEWEVPICMTDSLSGDGVSDLWEVLIDHWSKSEHSEFRKKKKKLEAKKEVIEIILKKLEKFFRRQINEKMGLDEILEKILLKSKSPQRASEEIFSRIADTDWTLSQLAEGRKKDDRQR